MTERGLLTWISNVLEVSLDQVRFMSGLLQLSGMQDRMPCSFTSGVVAGSTGLARELNP